MRMLVIITGSLMLSAPPAASDQMPGRVRHVLRELYWKPL